MEKILATLGAFVFIFCGCVHSPPAVRALPTPAAPRLTRGAEMKPAAVITAYYAALNRRDMETALNLLPDEVVFYTLEPIAHGRTKRVEYRGIEQVQRFVEGDQTIFSHHVDRLTVKGDTVEYTVTQWLNPRMAGMNISQPVVVHFTATVRDGKILSIMQNDQPF